MRRRLILAGATAFGLGYAPKGPGTAGSLGALLLFAWTGVSPWGIALLLLAGLWLAGQAEGILGEHDPSRVVIDEVVGMALALWSIQGWPWLVMGFLFFRIFDIWKPGPVARLQNLPGGWGVMADDVAAGILANLAVHGLVWFIH
jgi:phosphatidylglycerophosphatase A